MKRLSLILGLGALIAAPCWLAAQSPAPSHDNHAEVGVYGDYFRYSPSSSAINFLGLGGRVGVNMNPHMALEGELNYDFAQDYTSTATGSNTGSISSTVVTTGIRPLTGLFGPKFQVGTSGPFRAFVTGKVGFISFSNSNPHSVSGSSFTGAVSGVGGSGTYFAAYPGAGIEAFGGPIGVRVEVGDEIFLNNGTHNQLRATFGPVFRF